MIDRTVNSLCVFFFFYFFSPDALQLGGPSPKESRLPRVQDRESIRSSATSHRGLIL